MARPYRNAILAILMLLLPVLGHAQGQPEPTEESRRLARELIRASGASPENILPRILQSLREALLSNPGMNEEKLNIMMDEGVDPVLKDYVASIEAPIVEIYVTSLSVEDMQASIAFFESPSGKRWAEALPSMMQRVTALTFSHQRKLEADLREAIQKVARDHGWAPRP